MTILSEPVTNRLIQILGEQKVFLSEPLARHVSFRVGGKADYFLTPENREELCQVLQLCREENLPFFILGNGSNLLVSDAGYHGVIISLCRSCSKIEVRGNEILAQAGASLAKTAAAARDAGLTGLEFAAGIPGTVGGAVYMNAGAYGGEISSVLHSVVTLSPQGEYREYTAQDMDFGYRHSRISRTGETVWSAVFRLEPGNREEISSRMQELARMRSEKQPLEYPSAGSTFKRPAGLFAGKLIMDAGLKGCRIGGAEVSVKHSGFIINTGGATAMDIYRLMAHVRLEVYRQTGVVLMPEVKLLGDFSGESGISGER